MDLKKCVQPRFVIGLTYAEPSYPSTVEDLITNMDGAKVKSLTEQLQQLEKNYANGGDGYEEAVKEIKSSFPVARFNVQYFTGEGNTARNAVPSGLAMLDIDVKPEDEFDTDVWWRDYEGQQEIFKQHHIYLIHKSIRGHGLHVVFELNEGESIAEGQQRIGELLGVSQYVDPSCKDISRASFIPVLDYVLYIDEEGLEFQSEEEAEKWAKAEVTSTQKYAPQWNTISTKSSAGEEFDGVPTHLIIEKLVEMCGGTPTVGLRHNTYKEVAVHARYTCNLDPTRLYNIMPDWAGWAPEERKELCEWACSNAENISSTDKLREAIRAVKADITQSEGDDVWDETESCEPYPMPEGFPPLPEPWKMIVERLPEKYKTPTILAFHALYGTLATGYRMKDDGTETGFNFGYVLEGGPSSGKSTIFKVFRMILQPLEEQSEEARRKKREYNEIKQKTKNQQQQCSKPKTVSRKTPVDITTAQFIDKSEMTKEQGYPHLYTIEDELETVVMAEKQWKFYKVILRKAFDNGEVSQERVSVDAITAESPVHLNYLFAGTPGVVSRFYDKKEIEDGLSSRAIITNVYREKYKPVMPEWSEEEKEQIYKFSTELMKQSGMIYCPWLDKAIEEWERKNGNRPFSNFEYGSQYLSRAAKNARRAGYLWAVIAGIAKDSKEAPITGSKEEQDNINYMLWMADSIYAQHEARFYDVVKDLEKSVKVYHVTPYKSEILNELPEKFTKDDVERLRAKYPSNRPIRKTIDDWKRGNKITPIEGGYYQKTR